MGRCTLLLLLPLLLRPSADIFAQAPPPPPLGSEKIHPLEIVRDIGTTNLRHGAPISALDFHPSGKLLVAGSTDGVLRLWDLETGTCRLLLRDEGPTVQDVRFVAHGTWVRVTCAERMLNKYRLNLSRFKVADGTEEVSKVGGVRVRHTALSPAGDRTILEDRKEVRQYTADDRAEHIRQVGQARKWPERDPQIIRVAVASGGRAFAAAREDGSLWLWRVGKDPERVVLERHGPNPADLAFDSSGSRLIVTWPQDRIHVIDVATGAVAFRAQFEGRTLTMARPAGDPDRIVKAGEDGSVELFDVSKGHALWVAATGHSPVRTVAVSLDGKLIASGTADGKIHIARSADGRETTPAAARCAGFVSPEFLPVGERFVAAQGEDIVCFSSDSGTEIARHDPGLGALHGLTPLPDGSGLLATSSRGSAATVDHDGRVVWRTDLGGTPHGAHVFGPRGRWLLLKLPESDLLLLSMASGKVVHRVQVPDEYGGDAAFSTHGTKFRWTDGARLLTFDRETGEPLSDLQLHEWGSRVAFLPSGESVVRLARIPNKIHVHDCESGRIIRTIPVQRTDAGFTSLIVSPDAKWVLTGSGPRWAHPLGYVATSNVHLSDLSKTKFGRALRAGGCWGMKVGFGPATRFAWAVTLPYASHEETLRVFRMPEGKLLGGLMRPGVHFSTVRVSPDGSRAVASTTHGRLFLIRLAPVSREK